jgi:tetratricopeptide (TPR) repeat protein
VRDRWVALYIFIVLVQIPIYFQLGEGPLRFDITMNQAELTLQEFGYTEDEQEAVALGLERSRKMLERMGDDSSRLARLKLNVGILAWKSGKPQEAIDALEASHKIYKEKHGPDAFHAVAVDLRLAELYYLQRRYHEAKLRYKRSSERVRGYLGPRNPFVVRQAFREVCTLVALKRWDKAERIARANIATLELVADNYDERFLASTGASLDVLHRDERLGDPPGGFKTWKAYLLSLNI